MESEQARGREEYIRRALQNFMKVNNLQNPTTPPMAYRHATHGVVLDCEPDEDVILRVDGRTGVVVSAIPCKRKLLDADPGSAQWVRVAQDWLSWIVTTRKIKTAAEALCLVYVMARVRWSGIASVNQSDLAKALGHDTPRTVNRAMGSLVESGLLVRVGSGKSLYAIPGGVRKGKMVRPPHE